MGFLFQGIQEDPSDSHFDELELQRCPFLRNINKPTVFSFSSTDFPCPVEGAKGPIFEDGPNFDMAFKLFHGKDGIIPLSYNSCDEVMHYEPAPPFNPLAAKAATISLSAFGPGWPFGFGSFNDKLKKQKKSESINKNKNSPQGNASRPDMMASEWLEKGNCPIAKSYRVISRVIPLVASTLRPPPGMKLRCPPAVVAARAALARTALARALRPQPLPTKLLSIAIMGIAVNIPLGIWREHTKKFSASWFVLVHASVPFMAMLRKSCLVPKTAMALTVGTSILGQVIGSRAERCRLKALAETEKLAAGNEFEPSATGSSQGLHCGAVGYAQVLDKPMVGLSQRLHNSAMGGADLLGREAMAWDPLGSKFLGLPHPAASVCC